MKSRTLVILAALVAFAVLAGLTFIAGADAPAADEAALSATDAGASSPELDKLPPGAGSPGIYAARDWRVINPSMYPAVGGHETFTWAELEPVESSYDWTRLDGFIADQLALGKKSAIGITTYNGRIENGLMVPDWFKLNNPGSLMTCLSSGVPIQIPRYWNGTYQTKYGNFVTALANHLGSNANVAWVQIGVGLYGETQPADDKDDACIKAAMDADTGTADDPSRSARWVTTVKQIIDKWGTAFNFHQRLFLVYTPRFVDVCEKQQLTEYAAGRWGVGLFAGGTYADTLTVFSNPPGGNGCQKWDPIVYWNGVTTTTIPVALESYGYMLPTPTLFYWGVLGALNKHADYLNLESDLFFSGGNVGNPIPENLDVMRMANHYLGKTAATAPNAWVALRETSPASNGLGCNKPFFYAQYGDYDYWLTRDDTIAGGKTITASTIATYTINDIACGVVGTVLPNPYYDPLLAGKGPQGWTTRRTDHANGNDYMYFNVDPAFVTGQGLTTTVMVTVTYFDNGLDTWQLQWKNASDADQMLQVAKTNSNTWKTQTFTVVGISFTGRYPNGADFRIYNGGSGDEYIHMVMIGKPKGATPNPTPTRTGTATPTATPSPVTVTFQKGISPSPAYAGVIDTYISNFGDADTNYGISPTLGLRNSDFRAGLFRFDVSAVPPTVNVLSATLSVHVYNSTNPNPLTVEAYRVLRNWTEMGATWNRATASVLWTQAGANGLGSDRDDVPLDSVTMSSTGTWYDFDVTNVARLWVQQPSQNFGVVLKTTEGNQVEYELWSSNYALATEVRPKLTIVYSTYFPGPTATPTRTRTSTPSPTPTRTSTPGPATVIFQRGEEPIPGFVGVYDTFISNFDDATTNYGISSTLKLRANDVRAALLRFDISSLPPNANIINATISVHVDYKTNDFSMPVNLYKMTRSWNEMDATWLNATNATLWGVPGANGGTDHLASPTDSVVMSAADTWYDFDVTNLAKQWLANASDNKGVILKAGSANNVEYSLRSSEYFAAPSYRPKLTLQCYNCQPRIGYRLYLPLIVSLRSP